MATTYHTDLQKLYVAYFNRPADPGGLNHYEGVLERAFTAGGANAVASTMAAISADFAKSNEYQTTYNQATNAAVVTKVYQNLFGHDPDAGGLAFYVKALTEKTMTVDTMVTFIANGAQGTDKVAFDSKVTVATAFTNALNTDAEIAGYNVTASQTAAKTMLAGIKTAAQATAAVVPATLDASVAGVIKAGVPFTVANGLAALDAANAAVTAFLKGASIDLNADGEADKNVTEANIATNLDNAENAVEALVVDASYDTAKDSVKAAILAEQIATNAATLETRQTALTTANTAVSAKAGLATAIARSTSATEAAKTAADALVEANSELLGKTTVLTNRNATAVVAADGTVKVGATNVVVMTDGELVLATGLKATDYPGVTDYIAAANAQMAAEVEAAETANAELLAKATVEVLDLSSASALSTLGGAFIANGPVTPAKPATPTADEIAAQLNGLTSLAVSAREAADADASLDAAADTAEQNVVDFKAAINTFLGANTTTLADAVTAADTNVKAAQKAIEDLDEAVAELEEAQALSAELKSLKDAVTAATTEFTTAKFKAPVTLDGTDFGTSGADIFVANKAIATNTITSFGLQGDDVLYIGSGYTLNTTGDLTKGNDAALEVFFVQKGSSTVVTIETKAFGSNSADAEITITLTGVDAEDLTFNNGIISI